MQNPEIFQLESPPPTASDQQEYSNTSKSSSISSKESPTPELKHPLLMHLPKKRERENPSTDSANKKPKTASILPSPSPEKFFAMASLTNLKSHFEEITSRSKQLKSTLGKKFLPIAEPSRSPSTWDYLLGEMEWMSKYFEKERKMKISNAKKFVKSSQQYLRQKRESQERVQSETVKLRVKVTSRVCKIVKKYWKAIEKISLHLGTLQLEERRQVSRSRRLDKLVDRHLELSSRVAHKLLQQSRPVVIVLQKASDQWRVDEAAMSQNESAEVADLSANLFANHQICTRLPFMLKHPLREYQHIGLDWLVALHDKKLNGILADEMGLGKTIQTIALFAYLACERGIWGPHLIVVPTSIVINWEMELKKWCPGLKVLTYFGSQKERKQKRIGWSKFNSFNVCITSYKLVVQDQFAFKRKQWYYLVLDEAQHIKNFHSQRWQVLLKFNAKRRLLLSGTPLQNDVMELWSLLHFLMPSLFTSHQDFHAWFSSPFNTSIVQNTDFSLNTIQRLHSILRPFVLRRMKKDVEKQLPDKIEHVVFCSLSRRQQFLYDEFLERRTSQKEDCVGIMNILMQLRKVCNHPDLFSPRHVESPLVLPALRYRVNCCCLVEMRGWDGRCAAEKEGLGKIEALRVLELVPRGGQGFCITNLPRLQIGGEVGEGPGATAAEVGNWRRYDVMPVYGRRFVSMMDLKIYRGLWIRPIPLIKSTQERIAMMQDTFYYFLRVQPKIETQTIVLDLNRNNPASEALADNEKTLYSRTVPLVCALHSILTTFHLRFPDRKSIEHDCGKLRKLSLLLSDLKKGSHKCVIFTQMARMLDILESFMNIHGHTYVRLDGSTRVEQRQRIVDVFNLDPRIFCFISSTRSGGLGINLTGADVVIFYDTDWNPAMDKQAQDRCHRIGQTRNVHIYRLISAYTIEENILKKSMQKSYLDNLIMEGGQFTTVFLQTQKIKVKEFFENIGEEEMEAVCKEVEDKEDLAALNVAKEEEIQELREFDENQYGFLEQLEPITKKCIERYIDDHPIILDSSSGEQEEEVEESSESEEMAVDWVDGGARIYSEYLQFLKNKYLVY